MKKALIAGLGLAAVLATPALAQQQDANADLRRADVQTRLTERLGRADLNHDGVITQDEITTIIGLMQSGGAPATATDRVQAMFTRDATGGRLSIADVVTHQLAAFDAADANHDGVLTVAERQAAVAAEGRH